MRAEEGGAQKIGPARAVEQPAVEVKEGATEPGRAVEKPGLQKSSDPKGKDIVVGRWSGKYSSIISPLFEKKLNHYVL